MSFSVSILMKILFSAVSPPDYACGSEKLGKFLVFSNHDGKRSLLDLLLVCCCQKLWGRSVQASSLEAWVYTASKKEVDPFVVPTVKVFENFISVLYPNPIQGLADTHAIVNE